MSNNINNFMSRAIELSIASVRSNGGPFGCVIVKNNKIIAEGYNKVTETNDPTAHAEIVTIRKACNELKNFDDNFIYDELSMDLTKRKIVLQQVKQQDAIKAFNEWELKKDKIQY